jgi:hypothetical protein
MKALIVAALLSVASVASATPKPVVCLEFSEATLPVDGAPQKVVVCTDGKKPAILLRPSFVTTTDKDGQAVRIAIGWRQ